MLKNKFLASAFIILGVFTGNAYSVSSVRQLGAVSTSKTAVQPATTAAPKARSATPMISKITPKTQTATVKAAKTPTTAMVAAASTDSVRGIVGKPTVVGGKSTGTASNTQSVTLMHALNTQVQDLQKDIFDQDDGLVATINANQGNVYELQARAANLESKFNRDSATNEITSLKAEYIGGGIAPEKITGLTGADSITERLATVKSTIDDPDSGLAATRAVAAGAVQETALTGKLNTYVTENKLANETYVTNTIGNAGIPSSEVMTNLTNKANNAYDAVNGTSTAVGLLTRTNNIENKFNKDANTNLPTTLKADFVPNIAMDKVNGLTGTGGLVETVNSKASQSDLNAVGNRASALETKFNRDSNTNQLTTLKPEYVGAGIAPEKITGLTGTDSITERLAAVKSAVDDPNTGLAAVRMVAAGAVQDSALTGKLNTYVTNNNIARTSDITNVVNGLKLRNENNIVQYSMDNGNTWSVFSDGANGKNIKLKKDTDGALKWAIDDNTPENQVVWHKLYDKAELRGEDACETTITKSDKVNGIVRITATDCKGVEKWHEDIEDGDDGETPEVCDTVITKSDKVNGIVRITATDCKGVEQWHEDIKDGDDGETPEVCDTVITKSTKVNGVVRITATDCKGIEQWHEDIEDGEDGTNGTPACNITPEVSDYKVNNELRGVTVKFKDCKGLYLKDDNNQVIEKNILNGENGTPGTPGTPACNITPEVSDYKVNDKLRGVTVKFKDCNEQYLKDEYNQVIEKNILNGEDGTNGRNPVFKTASDNTIRWKYDGDSDDVYDLQGHNLGAANVDPETIANAARAALTDMHLDADEIATVNSAVLDENTGLDTKLPAATFNTFKGELVDEDAQGNLTLKDGLVSVPTKVSELENDRNYINTENFNEQSVADSQLSESLRQNIALGVTARGYFNEDGTLKDGKVTLPDYSDVYQAKLSDEQLTKLNDAITSLPTNLVTTENFGNQSVADSQLSANVIRSGDSFNGAFNTAFDAKELNKVYQPKLSDERIYNIDNALTSLPNNVVTTENFSNQSVTDSQLSANVIRSGDSFNGAFNTAFNAKNLDNVYQAIIDNNNPLDLTYTSGTLANARLNSTLVSNATDGGRVANYFVQGNDKIYRLASNNIDAGLVANASAGAAAKTVTDGAFSNGRLNNAALPNTGKFANVMNNFNNSGEMNSSVLQNAADAALANNTDFAAMQTAINGTCGDEKTEGQSCIPSINDVVQALIDAEIVSQTCGNHGCTWHAVRNTQSTAEQ